MTPLIDAILQDFVREMAAKVNNDYPVEALMRKLDEEVGELKDSQVGSAFDLFEAVDVMFVIAYLCVAGGYTITDLNQAMYIKYLKLLDREFEKQPDGTWHHVKSASD